MIPYGHAPSESRPAGRSPGLWHHPAFLKLWAASAISDVGSQISVLALPLIAALTPGATPWQMGLLSSAFGLLRIEILYVVALMVGALTVLFDVAYLSFIPSLVERERLVAGNSKLQTTA